MRDYVRHLSKGVALYGAGDVAIQLVKIPLLSVYVKGDILVSQDYGALGLIVAIEMVTKVLSRWGLDGAFMRYFHERPTGGPLELITSTIVWFTVAANAIVLAIAMALSGWISDALFPHPTYLLALRLMLVNTFLISLTYIPLHLMRLRNERVTFSAFVFARSAGTVAVQVALVLGLGWGLAGWFAADLIVTLVLLPLLWRWISPLVRREVSGAELRLVLRFGLPRVPHGLAQQALDAGNKLLLNRFLPSLTQVGIYQNGFTLGTAIRFFTSAFETAWAPFYYATSREPNGQIVLAKMTTYGMAALTLLVAITIAVSRDLVLVLFTPEYLPAAQVMPLIAVAMALQGVYLLTSIGLNLTSRTEFYPVATFAALGVGLGSGVLLMPRYGLTGAAVAFLLSAATQTAVAFVLARRFYPLPYETARILRVLAAGVAATLAGLWTVAPAWPVFAVLVRAAVGTAVFGILLTLSGFLRPTERAFLSATIARLRKPA